MDGIEGIVSSCCEHCATQAELLEIAVAQLVELRQPVQRTPANWTTSVQAGVTIDVASDYVPVGFVWLVERLVYMCDSVSATVATLYLEGVGALNVLDLAATGNGQVNAPAAPIYLPGGSRLAARWTGVTPPATARLHVQYRVEPLYPSRAVPPRVREMRLEPLAVGSPLAQLRGVKE